MLIGKCGLLRQKDLLILYITTDENVSEVSSRKVSLTEKTPKTSLHFTFTIQTYISPLQERFR